ncbi:hypothetical protein N0V90_003014 [Kalmusia sp. IMI 367209]|nr:hypothetical protein N0V90_003014 [Kalmusia sp. IMI 367209]
MSSASASKAASGESQGQPLVHTSSSTFPTPITKGLWTGLASEHSQTTFLSTERDYWRTKAHEQEAHITKLKAATEQNTRLIASLTSTNANLEARLTDALAAGNNILRKFRGIKFDNDALRQELGDARRVMMRLKKSDRAKGRMQQRNFRLKAHIGSHVCGGKEKEDTLLEALALTNQRIEELEGAGEKLLDALEMEEDNDGDEDAQGDGRDVCGVLEARVMLRGVVEDEAYEEHKALWADLLEN